MSHQIQLVDQHPTREIAFRKYQVIKRQDGFFSTTTEVIFKPEYFKSVDRIQSEQRNSIQEKRPFGHSLFSSVKVANIQINGNLRLKF